MIQVASCGYRRYGYGQDEELPPPPPQYRNHRMEGLAVFGSVVSVISLMFVFASHMSTRRRRG